MPYWQIRKRKERINEKSDILSWIAIIVSAIALAIVLFGRPGPRPGGEFRRGGMMQQGPNGPEMKGQAPRGDVRGMQEPTNK